MLSSKYLILLIFVLATIFLVFYLISFYKQPSYKTETLEEWKLEFEISDDCDKISSWKGTGYCFAGEIEGEKGIIVLHPVSLKDPGFVYERVKVPEGSSSLRIKIANLAAKVPFDGYYRSGNTCAECDSLVRIVMVDSISLEDEFVVTNKDGWVEKNYDITPFSGKDVVLIIYAIAGGKTEWNGEWLGIGSITLS